MKAFLAACFIKGKNEKKKKMGVEKEKMEDGEREKGGSSTSATLHAHNQDTPAQQQAVLHTLASYLEGELMTRLQSYCENMAEVEAIGKERSFYYSKLRRIEKVCEHARSFGEKVHIVEVIETILSTTKDKPIP